MLTSDHPFGTLLGGVGVGGPADVEGQLRAGTSEKEKLKENLYLKHVEAKSSSFITFSVEVNGRFSKAAQTMISKIENYADKKGELKQKLLSQLHQCNAQILLNAASLLN